MIAASAAAERGKRVLLLERNPRPGRKLLITGKGRCNVTNACEPDEFLQNVPTNPKFLYSSLRSFTPGDTMDFFTRIGVPLKVERGNRVFPCSDKAADVVEALERHVRDRGCRLDVARVTSLLMEDGVLCGVRSEEGQVFRAPTVVLATGGKSYPRTGSTGDGYALAEQAGHTITPLRPSLVPLELRENFCADMMGLAPRNVTLTLREKESGKMAYRELGELLFTHFGVSGPLVLSASAHMRRPPEEYRLELDWKPALSESALDARLLRDFSEFANRDFANALGKLLPAKAISVFVRLSGIPAAAKVNQITKEQRTALLQLLKSFPMTVKSFSPLDEAVVTSGGVSVKEVHPGTMQSKRLPGLYLVGELLDVDAYTGGFNLQIAFCTGMAAGRNLE